MKLSNKSYSAKPKLITRSSKCSLKFAHSTKLATLDSVHAEHNRVVQFFIDQLWLVDHPPALLPKSLTDQADSWLSARLIQACAKQASSIVRGSRAKYESRVWRCNQLNKAGKFNLARKMQAIIKKNPISKPVLTELIPMELDSRFVKIELDNPTIFDGWLTLTCLGNKIKITLPFKRHKHFDKLAESSKLRPSVRVSKDNIEFIFEREPQPNPNTNAVGVDIGVNSLLSTTYSNGLQAQSAQDKHGHTYRSINDKLRRRKKGSRGFQRAVQHRTNFINHEVNKIEWNQISQINREDIKHLRTGKKYSRAMSHFNYREIFDRLDTMAESHDVRVLKVNPAYTSQRCSKCGWVQKANRNGKQFKCKQCWFACDADLNASVNIGLPLRPIGREERSRRSNLKGFYWRVEEPIVPQNSKTEIFHDFL